MHRGAAARTPSDWIIDAPLRLLAPAPPLRSTAPALSPCTVSLADFVQAFQVARERTGHGAEIWALGARYDLSLLGRTGEAIRAAPCLGEALRCLAEGFALIQSGTLACLEIDAGRAEFQYRVLDPGVWPRQADAELTLGLVHGVISRFIAAPDPLVDVGFEHHPDAVSRRLEATIGTRFTMSAEVNSITIPVSALDARPSTAPADLPEYRAARRALDHAREAQRTRTGTVTRVREQILRRLGRETVDQAAVARSVGQSDRTLRLQLHAAGTSYRDLLEDCRRDMALLLLTTSALPLAEVSDRLGYAEQSVFSRAARRWFGCPPEQLRHGERGRCRKCQTGSGHPA